MEKTIDRETINELMKQAEASPRKRMHLDLRNDSDENSQRMANAILPEAVIPIHRHLCSIETVIILSGEIDEILYDNGGRETERHRLCSERGKYVLQIPAGVWHTAKAVTPAAIVEFKAGRFGHDRSEIFGAKE